MKMMMIAGLLAWVLCPGVGLGEDGKKNHPPRQDQWQANPFREVRGQYCDLRPMYHWLNGGPQSPKNNPMPAWQVFISEEVSGVQPHGVLFYKGNGVAFYVTNFPTARVKDRDALSFVARPAGVHRYVSVDGSVRSVALYDYGIPVAERKP